MIDRGPLASLRDAEFRALRQTIAWRGTVRMALAPLTMAAWALAWTAIHATQPSPAAAAMPLLVLAAGFEAIHALHVGVERIGRYLQVFFEDGPGGPQWESAAMRLGPGLPGAGADPLFTVLFALAILANLLLPVALGAVVNPATGAGLALVHGALVLRLVRARRAAARQRAVDLETFRTIRLQLGAGAARQAGIGDPTP